LAALLPNLPIFPSAAPLHCALSTLHGTLGGASMTTHGGAGTTHPPVLGTPASIMGRSSHGGYVRGLRPFASPHPDAARLGCPDLRTMGDATRGSPIPLHGGIKAHALCEENAHLRHMQRLIRALQRVTILLLSRACLYPPLQGGPAFLLPPPRPEALSPSLPRSLQRAHNTRRCGHPSRMSLSPIGVGLC
jgi:hypothetical protein